MMQAGTHRLDLSISLVNTSNWELLKPCIESIYENVKGISFEILVVDNASTDGSVEKIKRYFPGVILSENVTKFGFAKNNNINIKKASGRYLMLLNDDTLMLPGTLEKVIHFMDNHTDIGVTGCEMVYPNGEYQVASARKFRTLLSEFLIETGMCRSWNYIHLNNNAAEFVDIDLCSEAGMIVRREAVEKVGYLDEQFFMYGEGADWCRRIKQSGWKIVFLPDTQIIHYGNQTNKRVKIKMYLQFYKSTYLFFRKESIIKANIYRLFILLAFLVKKLIANLNLLISTSDTKKILIEKMTYYDALLRLFHKRIHEEDYPLPNFEQT